MHVFNTIGAPVIAEIISQPILVISILATIAAIASQFIEKQADMSEYTKSESGNSEKTAETRNLIKSLK